MFSENTSKDRICALFARFPESRTELNAASFDEKLTFWSKILKEYVQKQPQKLTFSTLNLQQQFVYDQAIPLCIDRVLELLIEQKVLAEQGQTWIGYFLQKVWFEKKPLTQSDTRLVHLELVDQVSQKLFKEVEAKQESTFDEYSFKELLKRCDIDDDQDVQLLVAHLVQKGKLLTKNQDITIYKFISSSSETITETDIGRVHLTQTIRSLHSQIKTIESKIQSCQQLTKQCLAEKKKQMALYHLKQRKGFEKVIQQRIASLETLELILFKIHNSNTELEILDAYKVGSRTLAGILGQKELQIENVEETMDKLQQVLEDYQDLENAMTSVVDVNEDELEMELDQLVEAEKVEALSSQLEQLTIPSTVPLNSGEESTAMGSGATTDKSATPLLA